MTACKDCAAEGLVNNRPIARAGRCATHDRRFRKAQKLRVKQRHVENNFRLSDKEYDAILAFQGGVCYLCRRASGKTKRLAVDHDHSCCPAPPTCGRCTRGLLCSPCNQVFGHLRDDPAAFLRGFAYLKYPPAQEALLTLD